MSNDEVAKIALKFQEKGYDPKNAVNAIIDEAHDKWLESGTNQDDITVIVVYFNYI